MFSNFARKDFGNGLLELKYLPCLNQVVVESPICDLNQIKPAGTSFFIEGTLRQPASPVKHRIALKAEKILHVGIVDAANYPLPKSRLPLDYMRSYPHLRPRKAAVELEFCMTVYFFNNCRID